MKNNNDIFGGMFDFNGDGKTDFAEETLGFKILEDIDKNSNEDETGSSYSSFEEYSGTPSVRVSNGGGGFRATLGVIAIVLSIFGWIYFIISSFAKCTSPSHYNSSGYSRSYKSYSYTSSKSGSSAYSYSSKSTSSAVQPTTKSYTYKSYSSKTKTAKDDDEYNAKDYDDPEDFYEDHYDDFDGFEDAEDYFDEHNR